MFLTLNTLLTDRELPKAAEVAAQASAIGADAVLIGRPFVPAVYVGEAEGAKLLFAKYKAELIDTMTMCGAHSLAEIVPDMVYVEK